MSEQKRKAIDAVLGMGRDREEVLRLRDDVEILTGDVHRRNEQIERLRTRLAESEAEVGRHRDEHGKRSEAWLKERQRAEKAEAERDDLLGALRDVTAHWDDYDDSEWGNEDPEGVLVLSRARAAIAKLGGGNP